MAFSQYKLRLITFTIPADGHKYAHVEHWNGPDDDAFMAQDFLKRAPDGKITGWEYVRSEQHVRDTINRLTEQNMAKGQDYRVPTPDEMRLTANQVRALSRQFPDVAARAQAVTDAHGNLLIPLDERAKVLERVGVKPPTADHIVAEALPELREEFEAKVGPVNPNA